MGEKETQKIRFRQEPMKNNDKRRLKRRLSPRTKHTRILSSAA